MGKILKTPKMPSMPALPEPEPIVETPETVEENEPTPDEQRVTNILARNRGRMGTITTSFNGILQNGNQTGPTRKTLLGE